MNAILDFVANQILGNAGILFALIAMTGLLLQRKNFSEIIVGTAKTLIGLLILNVGAGIVTEITIPVARWIGVLLNVEGAQPGMWTVLGISLGNFGTAVGVTLLIGFVLNLILARVTPFKFVNVTGHIMLLWAAWEVGILAGFGMEGLPLMLASGIIAGLFYWLAPTLIYPTMKDTMTDEWSLCMPAITSALVTYWGSRRFGNPKKNFRDLEVPDSLAWLRDSVVNIAILSMILWLILGVLVGPEVVQESAGSENWIIFLLMMGARFSAGIAIILYGVRMLLAEIVPAFAGIADALFPGAILGLDYPTVFGFSSMAVFIGFLAKLAGAIVGTLLMVVLNLPVVVLPSVFMDFWDGALMGVIADRAGGRRAAIIMPFIMGIVIQFGWMLMVPLVRGPIGEAMTLMDYPDAGLLSPIYGWINSFVFNSMGSWAVVILWIAIFFVAIFIAKAIGHRKVVVDKVPEKTANVV